MPVPTMYVWYFLDTETAYYGVKQTNGDIVYTDENSTPHTLSGVAHGSENWQTNTFRYLGEASDWQALNSLPGLDPVVCPNKFDRN